MHLNEEYDLEMTDVVRHIESDPIAKEQLEAVFQTTADEPEK